MELNLSNESGSLTVTLFGKNAERFLCCFMKQLMDHLTDPLPIDRESAGNSTVTSQPSSLD